MTAAYDVRVSSSAQRHFRKLPAPIRSRIAATLESLISNPRPDGVVKLRGEKDRWRLRVGDYRIVYRIEDEQRIVIVLIIAHRREVYR